MSYVQPRQVRGRAAAPWAWDELSPVGGRIGLILWTCTLKAYKLLSSDAQCGLRTPFVLVGLRYTWGIDHAVKLCIGPTFALHKYTLSRVASNYAVCTVAMFTIHGKPNGIVKGEPAKSKRVS